MKKVGINPSTQFHNIGVCGNYIEGHVMGRLGARVVDILNSDSGGMIEAKLFWNANLATDSYVQLVNQSNNWGADYLVSFHTDSAGDKRGYTGSLLCYYPADLKGYALGRSIQYQMLSEFSWPVAGQQARNDLYVLTGSKAPSCLLEIGNHSDMDDCKLLLGQPEKFAQAIAHGIMRYLDVPVKEFRKDDEMPKVVKVPVEMHSKADHTIEGCVDYDGHSSNETIMIKPNKECNVSFFDMNGNQMEVIACPKEGMRKQFNYFGFLTIVCSDASAWVFHAQESK